MYNKNKMIMINENSFYIAKGHKVNSKTKYFEVTFKEGEIFCERKEFWAGKNKTQIMEDIKEEFYIGTCMGGGCPGWVSAKKDIIVMAI